MQTSYQAFAITGVANTEVLDTTGIAPNGAGLTSTRDEPKTCLGLWVATTGQAGNYVVVAMGQKTPVVIPDYVLNTTEASGTNQYKQIAGGQTFIPLNIEIPEGETLRVGIRCGATNKDLYGTYQYQVGK